MQDNKCGDKLATALKGQNIDILINNAGYFYEPVEKIDSLNFEEVTYGGKFFPGTFFLFVHVTLSSHANDGCVMNTGAKDD